MNNFSYGDFFLKEMEAEVPASRHCLERIPETLFDYKPHEKSMNMGYLALLVAEIPNWIVIALQDGFIDFATFKHFHPKTTAELVDHLNENVEKAKTALKNSTEETFSKKFELRNGDQLLFSVPMIANISSTINHWVHHRGQLTVYMRLNNIAVPSIYGPSADERNFQL